MVPGCGMQVPPPHALLNAATPETLVGPVSVPVPVVQFTENRQNWTAVLADRHRPAIAAATANEKGIPILAHNSTTPSSKAKVGQPTPATTSGPVPRARHRYTCDLIAEDVRYCPRRRPARSTILPGIDSSCRHRRTGGSQGGPGEAGPNVVAVGDRPPSGRAPRRSEVATHSPGRSQPDIDVFTVQ